MNLPENFVSYTENLLGKEPFSLLSDALLTEPPVSVRLNALKSDEPAGLEQVPWCERGFYLPQRLPFTFDPLFHAGCYYVQEASSMFLWQAVRQYVQEPVVALDLCAAPGGKSTLLLDALPEESLLVANEPIGNRASVLRENIVKWGRQNVVVTNSYPKDFSSLSAMFDLIVADVPCSGEGMFRKDPHAREEWSVEAVAHCQARQRDIIRDVWQALKPGGLLIYSTCTFNVEENEKNIAWICQEMGAESLSLTTEPSWGVESALWAGSREEVFRFLAHRTRGEGFFLSVLRKTDEEVETMPWRSKRMSAKDKWPKQLAQWLRGQEDLQIDSHRNADGTTQYRAFPRRYAPLLERMKRGLHVILAGGELAEERNGKLKPSHGLAMSCSLAKGIFPEASLTYQDAIAYLRGETIELHDEIPKGMVLLTYQGHSIGFANQLGQRANNMYPQAWRIKSTHLPAEEERRGLDLLRCL